MMVAADLKKIHASVTVEEAEDELNAFAERRDVTYPSISKSWRKHCSNLTTLFSYPDDIRKVVYTTNAIESLNSVIRKAIKNRKLFPGDESAMKEATTKMCYGQRINGVRLFYNVTIHEVQR